MKKIAILGSTGSIGTQTLDVVRQHREDFEVTALSAGGNIDLLERQIREFHPSLISVGSEEKARELKQKTADLQIEIRYGMEGLLAVAAQEESQILVTAVVGMLGIRPTIAAIRAGKDIALEAVLRKTCRFCREAFRICRFCDGSGTGWYNEATTETTRLRRKTDDKKEELFSF